METTKNTITVTGANRGEHWLVAGDVITVMASGRDTSGNLLVVGDTADDGHHRPTGAGPFRGLRAMVRDPTPTDTPQTPTKEKL